MSFASQAEIKKPQWFIIKAVALPIMLGTILLMLPIAGVSGAWTDPLTALFMATSAMCVTGHTVVTPGLYFSHFGQLVLLVLMQIGGLGFMTLAIVSLVVLGRRPSIQNQLTLITALGEDQFCKLKHLLYRAIGFAFLVETIGALILMGRLIGAHGYAHARAFYYGVFHAVSAFCNAGLTLFTDSLVGLREDKIILLTICALVLLGGLGFVVIDELLSLKFWRRNRIQRGRLSLHTRVVVGGAFVLLLAGWAAFLALEWNGTLAPLSADNSLTCALFHSVTPRTAGFHVVDMAQINMSTRFMTMLLMFIGGAPGSTSGGIKTTTVVVLFFSALTFIRGKSETVLMGRTIAWRLVSLALSIFLLSITMLCLFYGALLITEQDGLLVGSLTSDVLLFELISAFATVGLSTGVLADLTGAGKFIMILCMFIGRIGPLTMALVIGLRDSRQRVRFPEEDISIG